MKGNDAVGTNVPSPFPSNIVTVLSLEFATAKSNFPSPLKSPTAIDLGTAPAAMGEPLALAKATVVVGGVTGKNTTFEVRVEPGLATEIEAVPREAIFAAGTVTVSFSPLTKVVASAAPFQLTVAPEVKPVPLTVRVNPGPAGATLVGTTGWLMKGTGFAPVPAKLTVCGLSRTLSAIVRAALLLPSAAGVKVTWMAQLAPTPSVDPQVCAWVKSPLFSPVMAMLVRVSGTLPVLVKVTVCAELLLPGIWSGKVSDEGDNSTPTPIPVPLKVTVCGLWGAMSVKLNEALRLPVADGVNVTLTEHVPLGITVAPVQVSALLAKSLEFVPLIPTVKMVRLAVPVLVTVTLCAALLV